MSRGYYGSRVTNVESFYVAHFTVWTVGTTDHKWRQLSGSPIASFIICDVTTSNIASMYTVTIKSLIIGVVGI